MNRKQRKIILVSVVATNNKRTQINERIFITGKISAINSNERTPTSCHFLFRFFGYRFSLCSTLVQLLFCLQKQTHSFVIYIIIHILSESKVCSLPISIVRLVEITPSFSNCLLTVSFCHMNTHTRFELGPISWTNSCGGTQNNRY